MRATIELELQPIRVPNYVGVSAVIDNGQEDGIGCIDIADLPDSSLINLAGEFGKHLLEHARTRRLQKVARIVASENA